jgi:hypothetical protein
MRWRRAVGTPLVVLATLAPVRATVTSHTAAMPQMPAAARADDSPRTAVALFRFRDPRIAESSGVAVATREPGVYFTHDDSGDSARFFAVGSGGATLAVYRVQHAHAVDWEDMAAVPDASGTPMLWFADIGDNDGKRRSIAVYVVAEPRVDRARRGVSASVRLVAAYRFRYPDGPHDAETLLVDPVRHRVFVVTKTWTGTSEVFAAPRRLVTGTTMRLMRAATLHWSPTGSPGGPAGPFGQLAATGGAVSPDASLVVVRTYTDAYVWRVGSGGVGAALRGRAVRLRLPTQPQGEGIAFARDGRSVVVTSERAGSTAYVVRLPASLRARPATERAGASLRDPDPRAGVGTGSGWPASRTAVVAVLGVVGLACVAGVVTMSRGRARRRRDRTSPG